MERTHDIVIAGAGPAGGSCARRACELGLSVLLVEKNSFPRVKPCAGGLSARGLTHVPADVRAIAQREVHDLDIVFGSDHAYTWRDGSVVAAMTVRDELDAELVRAAREAGAEVEFGNTVTGHETEGESVVAVTALGTRPCRFLVAADGARCRLGRAAGLERPTLSSAAYVNVYPADPRVLEQYGDRAVFDLGAAPRGYGWIFPKRDHLNVGVFTQRKSGAALRRRLEALLATHGMDGERAEGPYASPVPRGGRVGTLAAGRLVLVGDAAGLADPITGEGICYAVTSGRIAAEVMADIVERGGDLALLYRSRICSEVLPELRRLERMGNIMYRMGPGACQAVARSRSLRAIVRRLGPWRNARSSG